MSRSIRGGNHKEDVARMERVARNAGASSHPAPALNFPTSCPALCRASTSLDFRSARKDVDGRDKPGHDGADSLGPTTRSRRVGMTARESALRSEAKSSAPETELIDIGEQARLSARRRERIMSFASPLGLLLVWEIAGRLGLIDVRFFPVPSTIIGVMIAMIGSGELIEHVLISLQR